MRLWVDGQLLIDAWGNRVVTENSATVALTAAVEYAIKLEHYENQWDATVRLHRSTPSIAKQRCSPAALIAGREGVGAGARPPAPDRRE